MPIRPDEFRAIRLKLASPEAILSWSHGEVTKPETINYRTQRPEKEGLFSEVIFGPEKDFQCYCGKYKKARYMGVVCDKCGVEVTRAIVRRERFGHITLAAPVAHIWFLRKIPSVMGLFFDISSLDLEKVIYFAAYIITQVNEKERDKALRGIKKETERELQKTKDAKKKREIEARYQKAFEDLKKITPGYILSEIEHARLFRRFPGVFEAGIGAEVLRQMAEAVDLEKLRLELEQKKAKASPAQRKKILRRLKVINGFIKAGIRPEWMFLSVLPVIPPDLRPMVQLDGGRYASSDVNDLYRRVINRNNRLKKLKELNAPEVIMRNEKRMLQEAVDALIDNTARRGRAVTASTGLQRPLKSLADMLRGKQGRFRRNLLGKRVDYSGRSVIVVGPELQFDESGLPKRMALEIFKPFVVAQLIKRGLAHNIRGAGHLIAEGIPEVWEILEEVTKEYYILLNRAPTLHRLGIQAFRPVLIEGSAIQIHPLVCPAFNADFDGDQMAVHLPLSQEAQSEAKNILLSQQNLLKPATGRPIVNPAYDMVLGAYWLTQMPGSGSAKARFFADEQEALLAYNEGLLTLQEKIYLKNYKGKPSKQRKLLETSVGRIIFNQALPEDMPFMNKVFDREALNDLVSEIINKYSAKEVSQVLDRIKALGFRYSSEAGITWGMDDLQVPKAKKRIISEARKQEAQIKKDFKQGIITDQERRDKIIELWEEVRQQIFVQVQKTLKEISPSVFAIVNSGSRGSWGQIAQMMGLKGLVTNPAGEIIELPVISSFKEGFNVLEYFISTHGARKGTTDTALRTATAGYLTRRLIDVAHDIIVREKDCQTKEGIWVFREDCQEVGQSFSDWIFGRTAQEDIKALDGKILVKKDEMIDRQKAEEIEKNTKISKIKVRSPITCQTSWGVCQKCYGYDLAKNKPIALGEAVGIVAAQSIGEPGTQLTMRTFHMGGVAGSADITQGLPRVEEVFEARSPKVKALVSEVAGKVKKIKAQGTSQQIFIEKLTPGKIKKQVLKYTVPIHTVLWVKEGDLVGKGQQLTEGHIDLKELYQISGPQSVQRYIIKEIQKTYSSKGAEINAKHIEVITRKMFSRVKVLAAGDTNLLAGQIVERETFDLENQKAQEQKKKVAQGKELLLGITKVALTTDSFLSAASFQETSRALIEAAIEGKVDFLRGLKENVIIGRLIPAGTGFTQPRIKKSRLPKPKKAPISLSQVEVAPAEKGTARAEAF